jgi:tellurite resistance protein
MTTGNSKTTRSKLERLHPSLFGIPLGLLGLSGAWMRLQVADRAIPLLLAACCLLLAACCLLLAEILYSFGLTLLAVLIGLWMIKLAKHPAALRKELSHPVQGALTALIPVTIMLALAMTISRSPSLAVWLQPLVIAALCLQGVMAWHVITDISIGKTPVELITPALYLPTVSGGLVGAIVMQTLGLHGWAALLFGMGLSAWALLEIRILYRIFSGSLPLALRTTIGLEMAPAAVGALSAITLWPDLQAEAVMILLGMASGPVLAVLTRWKYWIEVPFNPGFWAFSFPLSALAATAVHAVNKGAWPNEVAVCALLVVTAVIAILLFRTTILLFKGQILPMQ